MSHSCEKDQCSSCLWKPYHSCLTGKSKQECEASQDHQWCGPNFPIRLNTVMKTPQGKRRHMMRADSATTVVPASCGTCTNCKWVPYNACYTNWTETQCNSYGSDYVWCGGNAPPSTPVYCCNSHGQTLKLQPGSSCPTGYSPISDSANCTSTVQCANPYYGSGSTTGSSCGLSTILPNNSTGLSRWLSIFTLLDPSSPDYTANNCGQLDSVRQYSWTAGCLMFGKGGMNGLTPFLNAASKFQHRSHSSRPMLGQLCQH